MTNTPPLAFLDTETTHLSAELGEVWEVAIIRRDSVLQSDSTYRLEDTEYVWQFRPLNLDAANPESLKIGRFNERFVVPRNANAVAIDADGGLRNLTRGAAVDAVTRVLRDAVIIGSNPGFDDRHLRQLLNIRDEQPWHYRPIDIATLAAGWLYGRASEWTAAKCDPSWYAKVAERIGWPWKSYDTSEAAGIPRPADDVAHTALGDARWCRDLWDHLVVPNAFYTATDDQLGEMASQALSRKGGAK